MAQEVLNVEIREKSGKGAARKLRAAGKIPAVVYGKDLEPTPVIVDPKELEQVISGDGGMNTLITLKGGTTLEDRVVVLKEADVHPIRRTMVCADFHAINLTEKSLFMVPINIVGTAIGQKEGGTLQLVRNELEVSCLPTQVPQSIDIDVTELAIGDTLHIQEVTAPEGVELVHDVNFTVLTLSVVKAEVEVTDEDEEPTEEVTDEAAAEE